MSETYITTACIKGDAPTSAGEQSERLNLLEDIVDKVLDIKSDALILPGGYFYLDQNIGNLSYEDRKDVVQNTDFGALCTEFAKALSKKSDGFKLITGVDSAPLKDKNSIYGGDQMAIAFDKDGVVGIGRKVFPVDEDIDGKRMPAMITYGQDFYDKNRVIELGKYKAILCSCYDMFGVAVRHQDKSPKMSKVKLLQGPDGNFLNGKALNEERALLFEKWKALLNEQSVELAISAIHRFDKPGREVFWQRHGIASASASLNSKFAIAAAHYKEKVPLSLNTATLTASAVPKEHLSARHHRQAHSSQAISLDIVGPQDSPNAVIRGFRV